MWVQVAVALTGIFALAFLLRGKSNTAASAGKKLGLALLAIAMVVTVAFPGATTWLAHLMGVGRGADVLLYAVTAAFVSYALVQYVNRQQDRARLNELARQVALYQAVTELRRLAESDVPPESDNPDTGPTGRE